jgi:hypothetical protein
LIGRDPLSKWVDYKSFCAIFHNQPTDLDLSQIKILFHCLLEGNDDMLNTKVFWDHILKPLNGQREKVIRHLWDNLNVRNNNKVPLIRLKNRFFGKFHPKVISRATTAAKVEADFLQNIDFHGQIFGNSENFTSWRQFYDFMFCWSSSENDDNQFLGLLVDCFRLSEFYGIYSEEILEDEPKSNFMSNRDNLLSSRYSQNNYGNESRYSRNNRSNQSRYNQEQPVQSNNIYSSNQNREENVKKENYYDKEEGNVNIYIKNQESKSQLNKSRGFNIISGRAEVQSRRRNNAPQEKPKRTDIRRNFYDDLQGKPDPKRDISQKRIVNTERKSHISRSKRTSNRSITRSRFSTSYDDINSFNLKDNPEFLGQRIMERIKMMTKNQLTNRNQFDSKKDMKLKIRVKAFGV